MDLTETIAPKSDQMNAEDLLTGPRTFTIVEVRRGSSEEQPVSVYLAEFPKDRPFKPSKTVRRIMVAAWGPETTAYVGHRMTLYRDAAVKFGGMAVGGIRVSHMSHLRNGQPLRIALTETRSKRTPFIIEPLPDNAPADAPRAADYSAPLQEATSVDDCTAIWRRAGEAGHLTDELKAAINARVAEVKAGLITPEDVVADESGEASWPEPDDDVAGNSDVDDEGNWG